MKCRSFFSEVEWDEKLNGLSLECMWEYIKVTITEAVKRYVPSFSVSTGSTPRRKRPPWLDANVKAVLRGKKKAYTKYPKSRHGADYIDYVKHRNMTKTELRKAVRNYEKGIAKKPKKDPKAFYRYVNGKAKGRGVIPDLTESDGSLVTDNFNKANVF